MITLGKMKITDHKYKKIIEETKRELREINQDHLLNYGDFI